MICERWVPYSYIMLFFFLRCRFILIACDGLWKAFSVEGAARFIVDVLEVVTVPRIVGWIYVCCMLCWSYAGWKHHRPQRLVCSMEWALSHGIALNKASQGWNCNFALHHRFQGGAATSSWHAWFYVYYGVIFGENQYQISIVCRGLTNYSAWKCRKPRNSLFHTWCQ